MALQYFPAIVEREGYLCTASLARSIAEGGRRAYEGALYRVILDLIMAGLIPAAAIVRPPT